jgi:uncharacterized repeat protein (TIGR02543 family)
VSHFKQFKKLAIGLVASVAVASALAVSPHWEAEPASRQLLIESETSAAGKSGVASGLFDRGVALEQKAKLEGTVRVIVTLKVPFAPEGKLGTQAAAAQRSEIAMAQQVVERSVPRREQAKVHSYETIPFMAMELDTEQLESVMSSPNVVDVREDLKLKTTLDQSVPFIRADENWTSGYTGSGKAVAVIDNGVQKTHPFLGGRVVSEACYSTHNIAAGEYSYCPGDVLESTAAGAAARCGYGDSCGHGTHVAGISSGQGASFSGVAKASSIIAIQTFHWSQADGQGLTYFSNVLKGLERVYALRTTYSIASVNMSLGGLYTGTESQCDSTFSYLKAPVDNLRAAGIATVIAAGNDSNASYIGTPGCISTAVAVGATLNASNLVASYSNSSSLLDLLAPGSDIYSSIPTSDGTGFTYGSKSGTSMATPHVAGCWAVLKQAKPTATVTEVLNALQNSGVPVTDPRNGVTRSRIDCKAAQDALLGAGGNYLLSVSVSGTGSGVVTSPNNAISCPSTCSASFASGASVVLTATPAAGSTFAGWTGACAGTSPTCTVSMTAARAVGAAFAASSNNTVTVTLGSNVGSTSGLWVAPIYTVAVPAGATNLRIWTSGGSGDADLYVRRGAAPTLSTYDCVSASATNTEECLFGTPDAGTFYVGIYAYSTFSGLTVAASYDMPAGGGGTRYGDHNGDGKGDLLLGRASDGAVAAWMMNGTSYSSAGVMGTAAGWRLVGSGDFNGDGKADVAFQRPTDGRVAIWLMNGLARIGAGYAGTPTGWRLVGSGDFNGDGKGDLLLQHASDGRVAIWIMNGVGYTSAGVVSSAAGWVVVGSGDFNGDGKADILLHRASDGAVAVWLMNGLSRTSAAVVGTAAGWTPKFTGHFTADTKSDIVFQHTDGRVAIWAMNGLTFTASTLIASATTWKVAAVRDFNGDGKSDLLWNSPVDAKLVWLMNGTSLLQAGNSIQASGWLPAH